MKRFFFHFLFWLTYFGVCIYNDLYLSESFSKHPDSGLFFEILLSQLVLLCIKIATTYTILYYVIPKWTNSEKKITTIILALITVFTGALIMRCAIHFVIWPFITHSNPPELNALKLVARYFHSLLELLQIVGVATAIKLYKMRMNAIENEKSLLQEKLKAEILHLKSQVNPHFLFNTLNSIYALSRSNSAQTPDAVMRLSGIMRYMLYEAGTSTISIGKEISVIEDYIKLQQLRFGDRIKTEVIKHIDNENELLAPLLLLPLIENSYKHGNALNATIKLEITVKDHKLNLTLINPVSENSVNEDPSGIGLKNIERQLQLLYGKHDLIYSKTDGTFSLHLFIDLKTFAENELFDHRR